MQIMAGRGLRAELLFALPTMIRANPKLLGYYRLVLGLSQKTFYHRSTGLAGFKKTEDEGILTAEQESVIGELCQELNRCATFLLTGIEANLTADHIDDLALLTYGPQLRGSRNVSLGATAVHLVFEVIRDILGERATQVADKLIAFVDATGRTIEIRFGQDPDIEVVSINRATNTESPLLAIEIKGGTDRSNAHNRLGEAEKSHLKAKQQRGFTDLWTIINVKGLSEEMRRSASPTTTAFFDLVNIVERQGEAFADFRERLLQKLRLPA